MALLFLAPGALLGRTALLFLDLCLEVGLDLLVVVLGADQFHLQLGHDRLELRLGFCLLLLGRLQLGGQLDLAGLGGFQVADQLVVAGADILEVLEPGFELARGSGEREERGARTGTTHVQLEGVAVDVFLQLFELRLVGVECRGHLLDLLFEQGAPRHRLLPLGAHLIEAGLSRDHALAGCLDITLVQLGGCRPGEEQSDDRQCDHPPWPPRSAHGQVEWATNHQLILPGFRGASAPQRSASGRCRPHRHSSVASGVGFTASPPPG